MNNKKEPLIDMKILLILLLSVALLSVALTLLYIRANESKVPAYMNISDYTINATDDFDINSNNSSEPVDSIATTTPNDSKYQKLGECKDYDTDKPYFVKTFIGNYKYTNGGYISDFCAEDVDSSSLIEFMCIDGDLTSESHHCLYSCLLGACVSEKEERAYMMSSTISDTVEWSERGVDFSIVSGYVGEMFTPINTQDKDGEYIEIGSQIHGLSFILDITNTNDSPVCAPLSLKRVVDETGTTVDPNINQFYFDFSKGGCTMPAQARTQYRIIFITEPGENTFVITAGENKEETFIVEYDSSTGAVDIEQTVQQG